MELEPFLRTAADLIAVPSTADRPAELHRALDLVLGVVGPGFTVERFESGGKPSALLYRPVDGPRPAFPVILNGHLDVVPGTPEQFTARREGERLYGRGTQDMKVSALVMAYVFAELAPVLPYPLALQLVTDEEVGGRNGTLHQLEQGVTGQFVVIGEQSGLEIVTDSKGILQARLAATGRAAHSAYPWQGDNALLTIMEAVRALHQAYPLPQTEAWATTVNLARLDTPNSAFNQVPASAEAWLDIRFPPGEPGFDGRTAEQIAAHLGDICGPGITVTVEHADAPHHADRARPEVAALRHAAQAQGFPAGFLRKHGAADGRFYSQRGIDAVIFGIGGAGLHGPDEYADLTTVMPYYRALRELLQGLPGRP
ncbi:M20 family metallopeptidase [Catellatospora bangladeshensis]|uniref:Peptidase M20 n=1 Tax=Catellatospora bangladeshensis TaxID=310355 RepID=A0A8J3JGD9_9ACTN|nr:M20/M25/M40 family metallo-hydrolase [Catellatospora bangladeshensis]GIF80176.1 peptidase M20 [Catellatospora bangladeshensis]